MGCGEVGWAGVRWVGVRWIGLREEVAWECRAVAAAPQKIPNLNLEANPRLTAEVPGPKRTCIATRLQQPAVPFFCHSSTLHFPDLSATPSRLTASLAAVRYVNRRFIHSTLPYHTPAAPSSLQEGVRVQQALLRNDGHAC